jgi:hypothetical protein
MCKLNFALGVNLRIAWQEVSAIPNNVQLNFWSDKISHITKFPKFWIVHSRISKNNELQIIQEQFLNMLQIASTLLILFSILAFCFFCITVTMVIVWRRKAS